MDAGVLAAPALEGQGRPHGPATRERTQGDGPPLPSLLGKPLPGEGRPAPPPANHGGCRYIELSPAYGAGLDARLHELLGREPTDDELAGELDMPTEKVNRLKDTAQAITSLDTPIGDDGAALQDFLEDDSAVGPDELAVEAVGREALEQVLAALPERERQVLILRFGLDSGTPRTLEEVGAQMGFSRERARQVERDALAALRSPEIRARLEDLVAA